MLVIAVQRVVAGKAANQSRIGRPPTLRVVAAPPSIGNVGGVIADV